MDNYYLLIYFIMDNIVKTDTNLLDFNNKY